VRGADSKGQEQIALESLGLRAIAHGFAQTGVIMSVRSKNFPFMTRFMNTFGSKGRDGASGTARN